MKMIPVASVKLTDAEIAAMEAVLRSGHLISGEAVRTLEERFARQVGAAYGVAVSSGTAALHVAYLALLEPGDEVLVPVFTHISTASMVHFAGGKAVLCDVDRKTFTISLEDAARKVTGRTRAIAPVHLFGNACDLEGIQRFAAEHNLKIVWDAAQAHGTRYDGRDIGSFADCVTYSFYPTKNMTTGEGGMLVTNDEKLYERGKLLRGHGQTRKYYHESLGLNYRMMEVSGALGLEQLKRLDEFIARRRHNADFLSKRLGKVEGVSVPFIPEGVEHSFHQYSILLDLDRFKCSRDEFVAELRTEGVETAVHYPRPVNLQPAFAADQVRAPNAEWLSERIMSLPVHPALTDADLDRVCSAVAEVARRNYR